MNIGRPFEIRAQLRTGARVGSWNAGVFGYYFRNGIVVGLDGLVNNDVYPYIRDRSVSKYCNQNRIRYFVDPWGAIRYSSPFLGSDLYDKLSRSRVVGSLYGQKEKEPIVLLDSFQERE